MRDYMAELVIREDLCGRVSAGHIDKPLTIDSASLTLHSQLIMLITLHSQLITLRLASTHN
jgi:hypothetical protein